MQTGALGRFRADDLAITSRVLCHLSYESDVASPHGFAPRPSVLETDVLLLNTTETEKWGRVRAMIPPPPRRKPGALPEELTLQLLVDGTGIEPVSSALFSKMRGRGPRQKSNRPYVGCRPRPRTELVLLNREVSSPGRLDGNALDPPQGFEP